jgi:Nif-specific regulatory protein
MSREGPSLELLGEATGVHCRSIQELSLLFVVSQTLENSFDLTALVKPLLRRMQDFMGLERGTIALVNRHSGGFMLSEAVGLPHHVQAGDYLRLIHPLLQRTVEKKEPVVVPHMGTWAKGQQAEAQLLEALNLSEGFGMLVAPLRSEEEVIGTISIERRPDAAVGWEADLRLMTMISALIGQAARVRQQTAEEIESLKAENERLSLEVAESVQPANMIGTSTEMRTVYYHIDQVAPSDATVLIRGESGTGKELVAKAIHERSQRSGKPFIKFNCAALPDSIIESELFGHEKGAFTGAHTTRKGRFEAAHGGTIFLDEIGDISVATQVKLLRVLQEKEFERVGSHTTLKCDVRVIAATSRDLETMMQAGTFREDLYYRLNVFPVYMPPLRSRRCDILLLADFFTEKYARKRGSKSLRISSAAIDLLVSYHWPGNVRELENCIERSLLLAKGRSIQAHHLPPTLQKKTARESKESTSLDAALTALERELIVDALKDTRSNMAEAARRLGLTERKMGLRVKKYELDLERFK